MARHLRFKMNNFLLLELLFDNRGGLP